MNSAAISVRGSMGAGAVMEGNWIAVRESASGGNGGIGILYFRDRGDGLPRRGVVPASHACIGQSGRASEYIPRLAGRSRRRLIPETLPQNRRGAGPNGPGFPWGGP